MAFFANFSATILQTDILFVLGPLLISFSIEDADNNVLLFASSIICAEKFFKLLETLNLYLSLPAFCLSLFLILNFFL